MRRFILSFAVIAFASACGKAGSSAQSSLKIVGGKEAASNDDVSKHTVALVDADGETFCSGTLIESDVVLTAAHCLINAPQKFYVGFGLKTQGDSLPIDSRREPVAYAINQNFLPNIDSAFVRRLATENAIPGSDLALVLLKEQAPQEYSPALRVASVSTIPVGATAILAGYGLTKMPPMMQFMKEMLERNNSETPSRAAAISAGQEPKDDMRAEQDPEPDNTEGSNLSDEDRERLHAIIAAFKPDNGTLRFTRAIFARATPMSEVSIVSNEGKAACSGDSGGPAYLIAQSPSSSKKTLYLLGVTSVSDCQSSGFFTDVRKFEEWIADTTLALRQAVVPPQQGSDTFLDL